MSFYKKTKIVDNLSPCNVHTDNIKTQRFDRAQQIKVLRNCRHFVGIKQTVFF